MLRHNEFQYGVTDLSRKFFNTIHMRDDPLIFTGHVVQRSKCQQAGTIHTPSKKMPEATEQNGNILIHDLWQNGTDSVHDMGGMNTDVKYFFAKTP